jgi:hypothetical protein
MKETGKPRGEEPPSQTIPHAVRGVQERWEHVTDPAKWDGP